MTSKHLFFRSMKEDLRHKLWMIALSLLGSFLSLPVMYLIRQNTRNTHLADINALKKSYFPGVLDFFGEDMLVSAGFIAIAGACIVGFFGFRYLFHRNMVDTYHSLPVKRRTLFLVNYLDGLIIWLVPFMLCLMITLVIALCGGDGILFKTDSMFSLERLIGETLLSAGVLLLAFLLVYHLVLVAVMLSGNVLNTIVTTGIIGTVVMAAYILCLSFLITYQESYCGIGTQADKLCFTSPLISGIHVLYCRANIDGMKGVPGILAWNLVMVIALGIVAYMLYLRRASELAEQGVKNRAAVFLMRSATAIVSAMGGWLVFVWITGQEDGQYSLAWGIFGALLAGILVFGVLDIIFQMDFKAFFAHKSLMLVSTLLAVGIGCTYHFDWMGYDTYLPEKEQIASLSAEAGLSNRICYDDELFFEQSQYKDRESIYEFLKTGVENQDKTFAKRYYKYEGIYLNVDTMPVKVTLTNGRSYYRYYTYEQKDAEVILPIVNSREYIDAAYRITEEMIRDCREIRIESADKGQNSKDSIMITEICNAYNQDLDENPRGVMYGDGRLLAQVRLYMNHAISMVVLDVYEGMKHTMAAMEHAGLGEYLAVIDTQEVNSITLWLGYDDWMKEEGKTVDYELWAREHFRVFDEAVTTGDAGYSTWSTEDFEIDSQSMAYVKDVSENGEVQLVITKEEEIKELMALMNYETPYFGRGIFHKEYIGGIYVETKDGKTYEVTIKEGTLPEKYILRFGELAQ